MWPSWKKDNENAIVERKPRLMFTTSRHAGDKAWKRRNKNATVVKKKNQEDPFELYHKPCERHGSHLGVGVQVTWGQY